MYINAIRSVVILKSYLRRFCFTLVAGAIFLVAIRSNPVRAIARQVVLLDFVGSSFDKIGPTTLAGQFFFWYLSIAINH